MPIGAPESLSRRSVNARPKLHVRNAGVGNLVAAAGGFANATDDDDWPEHAGPVHDWQQPDYSRRSRVNSSIVTVVSSPSSRATMRTSE